MNCVSRLLIVSSLTLTTIASMHSPSFAQIPCRTGFVWREAYPGDYICVTPQARDQVSLDNNKAAERVEPVASGTCANGYVWRNAFAGDTICVTTQSRDQAARDNSQASARVKSWLTGPDGRPSRICRIGFVWRGAGPDDFVCVTPQTRNATRRENLEAPTHLAPTDVCKVGFVWRETSPSDHVCVTPEMRDAVRTDNSLHFLRVFNASCEAYANTAVAQFRAEEEARCGLRNNNQRPWHDNFENHYGWCLSASNSARQNEINVRNNEINTCYLNRAPTNPIVQAGTRFDVANNQLILSISGTSFGVNEAIDISIEKTSRPADGGQSFVANDIQHVRADRNGLFGYSQAANCPFGYITTYKVNAREIKIGGRTSNTSSVTC